MKKLIKGFALTVMLGFLFSFSSLAQKGTVRGFVYDESTGEPVIFGSVFLEETIFGSVTDANGYFAISKVPVAEAFNLPVHLAEYQS